MGFALATPPRCRSGLSVTGKLFTPKALSWLRGVVWPGLESRPDAIVAGGRRARIRRALSGCREPRDPRGSAPGDEGGRVVLPEFPTRASGSPC